TAVHPDTIQIRVTDRGLGIDADDVPHVFKPFFRGRRAVDAQVRGTGVGLSIVRHVIDAHHGGIQVDSRPGEGTTVTVTLPAASARSSDADARPGAGVLGNARAHAGASAAADGASRSVRQ